jgi:hypothetical protein
MNDPAASLAPNAFSAAPAEPRRATRRILFFAALFFTAQISLVSLLGTKKPSVPRAVTNAPHFQLATEADELIALGDPTLFALPHAEGFTAKTWTRIPTPDAPDFRWQEPPRWLLLDPMSLGGVLKDFLQTNTAAETPMNFKAEPELEFPSVTLEAFFPTSSTVQISGALAQRKLSVPIHAPTLAVPDVIAPSRVQLLVSPDGSVFSVVLLESCGYADSIKPDQLALQVAGTAQFAPAEGLMFGEMLFNWHTRPVAGTNAPEPK